MTALTIVSVLVASLAACGHKQDPPGVNDTPETQKQRREKRGD